MTRRKSMNAESFCMVLILLTITEVGRAGPLDAWTWRYPLPFGTRLSGVTYGNGQFVAVGGFSETTIVTSTDGVSWASSRRARMIMNELHKRPTHHLHFGRA